MYYSHSTIGFYSVEYHGSNIPSDAIEITDELYTILKKGQSEGKVINIDKKGQPFLEDGPKPLPPTKEQVEELRRRAYANPVTGSDRFFAEATRLSAMGGPTEEIENLKLAGVDRYNEIRESIKGSV